ncbi:MAG TPA: hypothetical protein VFQ44_04195 [Streptosporangiaceae bacterium]|nr:hypothetical protein [Streptosporangiaceae bacterium]
MLLSRDRAIVHLQTEFRTLDFALRPGPIHGDAHTGNLLADHGQVVLLDVEAVAFGPREWALIPTSIAYERLSPCARETADVPGRLSDHPVMLRH